MSWLKRAVLKTAIPERVSGVRIPLPPPSMPLPSLLRHSNAAGMGFIRGLKPWPSRPLSKL